MPTLALAGSLWTRKTTASCDASESVPAITADLAAPIGSASPRVEDEHAASPVAASTMKGITWRLKSIQSIVRGSLARAVATGRRNDPSAAFERLERSPRHSLPKVGYARLCVALRFTLDQLEVLEAIDRFGSFAAAAKHLHRATSAVSYAVKSLESALGVSLFERTGRSAKLTAAGRVLLESGRDVLERSRRLERLGTDMEAGWEPELKLVVDGVLPQAPLVRACQRFLARRLSTRVLFSAESLSGVRRRFARDEAHLMLAVELAGDPRLVTQPLPPVEMLLVAHRSHVVHKGREPVDRTMLASFVEVLVADSGARDAPPPPRLAQIGSPHLFELSDFHSKRVAIVAGLGFGWLPAHLVEAELASGELLLERFDEGNRYVLQPLVAHRRDTPLGPAGRALLDDIIAESHAPARRRKP